jgi:hypothetical protein
MVIRSRIPPVIVETRQDFFKFTPKDTNPSIPTRSEPVNLLQYEMFHKMFSRMYRGEIVIQSPPREESQPRLEEICWISQILETITLDSPSVESKEPVMNSFDSSAATSLILDDFLLEEGEEDFEDGGEEKRLGSGEEESKDRTASPASPRFKSAISAYNHSVIAPPPSVPNYSSSITSEHSTVSLVGGHCRKFSERIGRFVDRVSGRSSPRGPSRVEPRKTHAEAFRDSLAEASSLRDSFIERYYNDE